MSPTLAVAFALAQPWLLLLGPLAVLLLWLLERWRLRPLAVVVADVTLFAPSPEAVAEARARRRRASWRWLLRAAAALLLALAAAAPEAALGEAGPLEVELVLDRGLSSATREPGAAGVTRLELHRRALGQVLERLRAGDRVRLHLAPGGPAAPLAPEEARAALAEARPVAALADLEALLGRLGPVARGRGEQVFVATDRALAPDPALAAAHAGSAQPSVGLIALGEDEAGDLVATVAWYGGAAAPVTLELAARASGGALATATREARPLGPPARGERGGGEVAFGFARWRLSEGLPPGALEASARLRSSDDPLATDDVAFAVRAPVRPRRVGLIGDPGPAVRRALRAVPGVELIGLAGDPDAPPPPGLDLLVLPRLPRALPPVGICVVPAALEDREAAPGGRLVSGAAAPALAQAFEHTLAALAEGGAVAPQVGPRPPGLPEASPLIEAGGAPLVLVQGAAERLVVAITTPLSDGAPWTRHGSFPLFWAELLELAAPRSAGRLEAVTAGAAGPPGLGPLWEVRRYAGPDGAPWVGTVAPPLAPIVPAPAGAFPERALAALEARRPSAPRRPLAPALALLAGVLLALGWAPDRRASRAAEG